ncbi:caspase family protein [Actinoplanes sp. NPDC051343]|uniref:caspase, EACC1-associated type n=1 Tax=Actinoplanes sp. NPDC051343 TaxID=3363906 RepID=UPI0037A34D26
MVRPSQPDTWLPDPRASRAVLIGVSDYADLEPLPAVERNLQELSRLLTSPDLWGLRTEDCHTLLSPQRPDDVLDAINTAAGQATDALIVYFAGHGLLDQRDELHLALTQGSRKKLYRTVRYDDVRREVVETARKCHSKVVILDCCYSGRAMQGAMGSSDVAEQARIAGTYLMTATAETSKALAPLGAEFTAFTGALIRKLSAGVIDGPELLDLETLFYHLRAELAERRLPMPQQRSRNDGSAIGLVRNRAYRPPDADGAVAVHPMPEPRRESGFEPAVRRVVSTPPAATVTELRSLRGDGQDAAADELLATAEASHRNQELAALARVLLDDGLTDDFRTLARFVTRRSAGDLLELIRIFEIIGSSEVADGFLDVVAAGPPKKTSQLAKLLRDDGRGERLNRLVDAALTGASDIPSRTALIGELWVAGLRDEVDQLVQQVATGLPAQDVLALADELRTAGREGVSFQLYGMATAPLSGRPPRSIAHLTQSMTESGYVEESQRVAYDAALARKDASSMMELATEYITTGQKGYAYAALDRGAQTLGDADVADLARALRDADQEDAAFHLLSAAVAARPASSTMSLVNALRDAGRPVDAIDILKIAARRLPPEEVANLLRGLGDRGNGQDYETVLSAVGGRSASESARLLQAVVATGADLSPAQVGALIGNPTDEDLTKIISELEMVRGAGAMSAILRHLNAGNTNLRIRKLIEILPERDAVKLFFQVVRVGGPTLSTVIRNLTWSRLSTQILRVDPTRQLSVLVAGLRRSGFDMYADMALSEAAWSASPESLAIALDDLRRNGQEQDAEALMREAVDRRKFYDYDFGRSAYELLELILALEAGGLNEELHHVVDRIRVTRTRQEVTELSNMLKQVSSPEIGQRLLESTPAGQTEPSLGTRRWRWGRLDR